MLEPLYAYLIIAQKQYEDANFAGYYNVGPDECDYVTTGDLVQLFCKTWGNGLLAEIQQVDGPHEANFLKLDCSKLKKTFNWKPRWNIETAIEKTVDWTRVYVNDGDISKIMDEQICEFLKEGNCV